MIKPNRFFYYNENTLLIEYPSEISEQVHECVVSLNHFLTTKKWKGIIDVVPAYTSITITFNTSCWTHNQLKESIERELKENLKLNKVNSCVWTVPVCYDKSFALDIDRVCTENGISLKEGIQLHQDSTYKVYMLGFMPGFVYLGGLNSKLITPRLSNPRTKVEEGSVAIGGSQAGIYSLESPGGWNIIGRTPISFFRKSSDTISDLKAGDELNFYSVSIKEFKALRKDFNNNRLSCKDFKND